MKQFYSRNFKDFQGWDPGTVLWHSVDDLELRASRSNVCKVVEGMLYISPMKRFNLPPMRTSQ